MALIAAIFLAVFVLPSPWNVLAVAGGLAVEVGEAAFWVRMSQRRGAQVGREALVGALAEVVAPCRPEGTVRVHGELWRARCDAGVDAGERVRVRAIEGLMLVVEPLRRRFGGADHQDVRAPPARPSESTGRAE